MADFRSIDDLKVQGLAGKRVLVRADLNVPMQDGAVSDSTRIDRVVPTLTELADAGAKVIVASHFGRPKGKVVADMSLEPVAAALSNALEQPVSFAKECVGEIAETAVANVQPGQIILLENLRFHEGEEANEVTFTAALARHGDVYVNDAFSCAHRAHASTEGLAHRLPSYAGRGMQRELEALDQALGNPEHPVAALVGGAKVSSKLDVLGHLVEQVDVLIIGGGMANTFLNAQGVDVGASLCEHDLADTANDILSAANAAGCRILLPQDCTVAREFAAGAENRICDIDDVHDDELILDIGPQSMAALSSELSQCKTLVWNGPLGAFEIAPFDAGTNAVAKRAGALSASGMLTSIAGGGDTVAALNHAGAADQFTYVSTAGGAFLEWLEGRELPGVAALAQN